MNNQQQNNLDKKDFKRLFNMNSVLSQLISYSAYIILGLSVVVLLYLSFVQAFHIKINWLTLGIFAFAAVFLSYLNWSTFYKRQYEKLMAEDIAQHSAKKYSIHARYYFAIKDWSDIELQKKIDEFNAEYTAKWLRYVEKVTGVPIETREEIEVDQKGRPILDENGQPKKVLVKGIKDLPYKGFHHKILMWRIKHHVYPQSGYKSSMELMSLFSFQDSNLNKRNLKADKQYFMGHAITKFFTSLMAITVGAAVIPEMINGEYWSAILKLLIAIVSLFTSVIGGCMQGISGARLKMSVVEDACADLERWAGKKPLYAPYENYEEQFTQKPVAEVVTDKDHQEIHVTADIFNKNMQRK